MPDANRDRVLDLLGRAAAPLDDDEISVALAIFPRQQVNSICRELALEGLVIRERGPSKKIANRLASRHEARAFVLTYNPDMASWTDAEYAADVQTTSTGHIVRGRWSTGTRSSGIRSGDRAYLFRQVRDRGLIASGVFTSAIYPAAHWADSSREARYADVDWDCLLDPSDRFPVEELVAIAPGVPWNRLQGSGVSVPAGDLTALEERWSGHVGHLPYVSPEEGSGELFSEGRRTRVVVNRYERDRNARAACLAHYGHRCQACDLDFEERYGQIGEGFIHVHHVEDIALAGTEYQVDPVADLRPVCPNCHAMLHKTSPAMTVDQLKKRLAKEARRGATTRKSVRA